MKVKELMEHLAEADPEAEVITDVWNGRISTYTVLDNTIRVDYDVLKSDFFGTPGAFDRRLHQVESGKFFLIGFTFTNGNKQAFHDRYFIRKMLYELDVEEPDDVKAARILQMLRDFDEGKLINPRQLWQSKITHSQNSKPSKAFMNIFPPSTILQRKSGRSQLDYGR